MIFATERPLTDEERKRAWERRRDAHLERSRSRTGTGTCPAEDTQSNHLPGTPPPAEMRTATILEPGT